MELVVDIFLGAMATYLIAGLLFGILFIVKLGERIDEGVKGTPWHFKAIIFPGVVLFWSVLLRKLFKKS